MVSNGLVNLQISYIWYINIQGHSRKEEHWRSSLLHFSSLVEVSYRLFYFIDSLLIVIDMHWVILWRSPCTLVCGLIVRLVIGSNPETVKFIILNPLYWSDALNIESLNETLLRKWKDMIRMKNELTIWLYRGVTFQHDIIGSGYNILTQYYWSRSHFLTQY